MTNDIERAEQPSPVDDAETRAFIAGWNAKLSGEHDFDMALHWWNREQCGLNSVDDLAQAAITALSPTPDMRVVEVLRRIIAQIDHQGPIDDWEKEDAEWDLALSEARTLLSELEGG